MFLSVDILGIMTESLEFSRRTSRKDRLIDIIDRLRDGEVHRGEDLARELRVSQRTLYRDMETLMKSGVPVAGARGIGYQMTAPVTLPPLNLSMAELEALHLGLAVMTEADDPGLRSAARTLADKIDEALPETRISSTIGWGLAVFPFADTASGIRHMPAVRSAIRRRKKLQLTYDELDGTVTASIVRPLNLDYWGRVWTCKVWCERSEAFRTMRLDRISTLTELSAAFRDGADEQRREL